MFYDTPAYRYPQDELDKGFAGWQKQAPDQKIALFRSAAVAISMRQSALAADEGLSLPRAVLATRQSLRLKIYATAAEDAEFAASLQKIAGVMRQMQEKTTQKITNRPSRLKALWNRKELRPLDASMQQEVVKLCKTFEGRYPSP